MDVYVVHGIRKYSFTGKDGKLVEGYSVFCGQEFTSEYGEGHDSQKFNFSAWLVGRAGFVPMVGDRIVIHARPGDGRIMGYEEAK